ncbi:MAG: L,D-transpeptidase [Chromatiales bacterium]|nr:MAG: L,D-transpeptidase [Chromatiales bacterium]
MATDSSAPRIIVSLTRQRLELRDEDQLLVRYPVSTSRYGPGERDNSQCTPRGLHRIRACIGAGLPAGAVLVGRRPTGEIYDATLARLYPERDWILTRVLWLCGCEPGRNRLGNVDSMRRYIYIHGTPDREVMGVPFSHGCIRMRNADVVDLFDRVNAGTLVDIQD